MVKAINSSRSYNQQNNVRLQALQKNRPDKRTELFCCEKKSLPCGQMGPKSCFTSDILNLARMLSDFRLAIALLRILQVCLTISSSQCIISPYSLFILQFKVTNTIMYTVVHRRNKYIQYLCPN